MRIIPVIDVMGGQVVRAVGGRRSEYRPVRSRLTDSTEPVEVARVLLEVTGSNRLYVADLDAIVEEFAEPTAGLAETLSDSFPNTAIWLDCGMRPDKLPVWKETGSWLPFFRRKRRTNLVPILGSESMKSPAQVDAILNEFAPGLGVSIDLMGDRWIGHPAAWTRFDITNNSDVLTLAQAMIYSCAAWYLILIDLARVGTRGGIGTERWIELLKNDWPELEIYAGGGVRGWEDVKRLEDAGADGVLVASALHDGTLTFPRPS